MEGLSWSPPEKRLARELFMRAAAAEEAELLLRFKQQVAATANIEELWALSRTLQRSEREFQEKYDFRYSQLLLVLGRLVREGRILEPELQGFSEEKRQYIKRVATL